MQRKLLALMLILSSSSLFAQQTYVVDAEHSSAEFEVKHLMISTVTGRFTSLNGTVILNKEKSKLVSVNGFVSAKSVNTNQTKRDEHLRSKDFFHAGKYPKLELRIDGINLSKGSSKKVRGHLTIRGIKKQVTFNVSFKGVVTDPWGTEKAIVDADATINREDFGLTWNETLETGGVMVGKDVVIKIRGQANLKE